MNFELLDKSILTHEETATMRLRTLYRQHGYTQYKSSRFEEYALYAEHKAFLPSDDIITFTGVNGKLMALRPDVTLSIVKNAKYDSSTLTKLCYNENVYRSDGSEFKEQTQIGLECIGNIDISVTGEVLMLAKRSLEALGMMTSCPGSRLDISHMGFINGIFEINGTHGNNKLTSTQKKELLKCISEKNTPELDKLCEKYNLHESFHKRIVALTNIYGPIEDVARKLKSISINEDTDAALEELCELGCMLNKLGIAQDVNLDFSIVNDISYYSGIIFQGFIEGIPSKVLSGGRYDMLMRKFSRRSNAIGFAVYLNLMENSEFRIPNSELNNISQSKQMINIALPKGRLGDKAFAMLEAAGYGCPEIHEESRRLIFESPDNGVRYFWVKPSDVAIYVERGAADVGIVGKDMLLEYSPDVYELLDLRVGKCRICVAAQKGASFDDSERTLRVVTIFPNIARDYYAKQSRDIEIIKLHGSIELAPTLELGDVIVDIVETGKTLLENDLEPIEDITEISARLIANKASYRFKHDEIVKLCKDVENSECGIPNSEFAKHR